MNTCAVDLCLKITTEARRGQKELDSGAYSFMGTM